MQPTRTELDAIKARTLDGIRRCLAALAAGIARDGRHCGKAACARSRRCRGTACEREPARRAWPDGVQHPPSSAATRRYPNTPPPPIPSVPAGLPLAGRSGIARIA